MGAPINNNREVLFSQEERILDQSMLEYLGGTCINDARLAQEATMVERVPRYSNGEKENIAEHAYMMSLVAMELVPALNKDRQDKDKLDIGLVLQFITVHDLVEIETKNGDTSTFAITETGLKEKAEEEAAAMVRLRPRLGSVNRDIVNRYEEQKEPEAVFVRKFDKIMPVLVELISEGQTTRALVEEEGVRSVDQFKRHDQANRTRMAAIKGFSELDEIREFLGDKYTREFARELATVLADLRVA